MDYDELYEMKLLDSWLAPPASGPFQLAKLLFREAIELCKFCSFLFSLSTDEMAWEMEACWQWILDFGRDSKTDLLGGHHKEVKILLSMIVELIYDIQHLCDGFLYHVMQQQVDDLPQAEAKAYSELRFAIRIIIIQGVQAPAIPMVNLKFSDEVSKHFNLWRDGIRRKIDEIHSLAYSLTYIPAWFSPIRQSPTFKTILTQKKSPKTFTRLGPVFIGREKEKKKILDWLSSGMKPNNNFSTIAIVGQGGMGKTKLAHLVFKDDWVTKNFDLMIWSHISQNFIVTEIIRSMVDDIRTPNTFGELPTLEEKIAFDDMIWSHVSENFIVTEIIRSNIGDTRTPNVSEILPSLEGRLMRKLAGHKLLLVLDDVWNEDPSLWESLKAPLLAAECTRVIVTTRSFTVAEIMQTTNPVRLGYLSEANSLELLKQCAFQRRHPEKLPALMEMGKHIVKKCGGLPLAVISLANYLRFEHHGVERIDAIPDKVLKYGIFPSLIKSYYCLSTQLKCCFIYCSMFPECYGFTKDELVRLWIAQGYVWGTDPKEVEDIGSKCFDKLYNSSFFDFSHCEANATRVFTIPIFIHALAKHIAGDEYVALSNLQCIPESVRHLYVGSVEIIKYLSHATAMKLRTFVLDMTTFHGSLDFILDMIRVRSLILIIENVQELPGLIGNVLKSLRYLRIKSCLMEKLPGSIVELCHLQVLDLSYSCKLKELPLEIGRLVNLRTLCLNGCTGILELPITVGNLSMLQNLHLVGSSMRWMHPAIRELRTLKRLHYKRTAYFTNSDSLW